MGAHTGVQRINGRYLYIINLFTDCYYYYYCYNYYYTLFIVLLLCSHEQ